MVKQMSTKERLVRKKYMGVCRCGSELMTRMMSAFPAPVTRYIHRKSQKWICCCPGPLVMPSRRNLLTPVSFSSPLYVPVWIVRSQNWIKFICNAINEHSFLSIKITAFY
jgi:hypothetical protein